MDGHARVELDFKGQVSYEAKHSLAAVIPANEARRSGEAPGGIAWLSTRLERWPPHVSEHWPPPDFKPFVGVACLSFGVGAAGAGWLARLVRSGWFAGMDPRAEDLAVSGGAPCGRWALPDDGTVGTRARVAAETEAFFVSQPLPKAWFAMIAVPHGVGLAGHAAVLGLVSALRARRDPGGRTLGVAVTVEAASSVEADAFVRSLLDKGAFVVRGGAGQGGSAAGDLLHHFLLRALTKPRLGRLICVDFADYMHVWRPGRVADLHMVPFAGGDAGAALRGLPLPAQGAVRALNLGFHLDLDASNQGLVHVDRFVSSCCELVPTPDEDVVFATMDRLDGVTGTVDLLVVHGEEPSQLSSLLKPWL